jgi:undecaprenyl-diphosphatase
MFDWVLELDRLLFIFFNQILANPVTDEIMPFVTDGAHWVIAVVLFVFVAVWQDRWRGAAVMLGVVAVFALCDQSSAHWLKPVVKRVRPCHVVDGARLLVHCTQAYSFPSAHATNSFGCAVWLTFWYPQYRWVFFGLALLVSISRVFVGVHYPFDVLAGWILGTINAVLIILIAEGVRRFWKRPEVQGEG